MKQRRLKTLDEAVAATLEMESYASTLPRPESAAAVQGANENDERKESAATTPVAAVDSTTRLERLMERVEVSEQNQAGPSPKREEVRTLIQEMLTNGIVERSTSPWASPIVLVRKKDGSSHFCVDYRRVNGVTRKDVYPLPLIDTTLDALAGLEWFSTLDLLSGSCSGS